MGEALPIVIFLGSVVVGWAIGVHRIPLPARRRIQPRPDYHRIAQLERELGIGAPQEPEASPPRPASAQPFLPQRPYR